MQPSRILPDLQCSLVCEQVRREANGNFFLIGVMDGLVLPKFPIVVPALCVFNRWTAGMGRFVCSLRLMGPDQTTLIQKGEIKFEMQDPNRNATTLLILQRIPFQEPGLYFIEVTVDDVMKVRYPLPVIAPPEPQRPASSQAPPPTDLTS